MALRTAEEYRAGLRDDRVVWFRGERVRDVTTHPVLRVAVDHAATDFTLAEDPNHRDLAVTVAADGEPYSRYWQVPHTAADLRARSALIETATAAGGTLVVLVKEIGSDALFGLLRATRIMDAQLRTPYLPRVEAFLEHMRRKDLTASVAQTDVKGDRSLGPASQPDAYVRIVERRPDGIVVSGAKVHTSCTPNVDEIIVLPTRALSAADADHAVAFAVPVATEGVTLVASPYGSTNHNEFEAPLSSRHRMMETVTIFDRVFVPHERVFLAGEHAYAGPVAMAFVDYHRFTAISYKLPLVDLFVGSAHLLARANGISRTGHVREKIVWLTTWAETVRGLTELAAGRARIDPDGIAVPDPLTVNIAKSHFAHNYHQAVMHLQELAGALLVTAPSQEDFDHPVVGPMLRRYLAGAGVDGAERVALINLVSDLTTGEFGGYQEVLAIHAEGSLEAEKLMIARSHDPEPAIAYARSLLVPPSRATERGL